METVVYSRRVLARTKGLGVASVAAAIGLITGLVEGAALLSLQHAGWLGWRIARVPIWTEILVISPVVDVLLFLSLAAIIVLAARVAARVGWGWDDEMVVVLLCSFLMWFDWLSLLGRLRLFAVVALATGLASLTFRVNRRSPAALSTLARTVLPWCVAATALAGAATYGRAWLTERTILARLPQAAPAAPNVLVIVLDTVRADHLSSYGYPRPTTPFLDHLAAEGVLFDEAYSTSSWTLPAHGSLLTGLLPHEHGGTTERLGADSLMISEVLTAHGYKSAAFSANLDWFTRRSGFARGFATFADFFQSSGDMAGRTLFGRMFDEFVAERADIRPLRSRVLAADINRSALGWLDAHPSPAPFFLVLNYFDAHGPYEPPQPFRRQFSTVPNPGGLLRDQTLRQRPRLTPAQVQSEVDAYDGAIAYLDAQVRTLVAELERRGLLDKTIVIVASDHGESFGEHGLFTHRTALYRELIRVPLILRWPGHVPAGTRVQAPVSLADVPATLVDLLRISPATEMPGLSFVPTWGSPAAAIDRPNPVQELARMPFDEFNWVPAYHGAMQSVVTPTWHYIAHEALGPELYDIARDPQELASLMTSPAGPKIAGQLAEYLRTRERQPTHGGR